MTGAGLLGWAVEALLASALLMALVLAVRAPVRRAFGPQVGYALWALPALRLLLPPLPAAWPEHAVTPFSRASEAVTVLIVPAGDTAVRATSDVSAPAAGTPWGAMLLAAWALGAAGFFGLHLWRHRRFCARLLAGSRLLATVDGVRVIESAAASGPLAFGVAHRFVAFPRDFDARYDAHERELALAHELGHHARGDLLANWAALAVLALHWFNPLAWRAFRAFRCDQELANDARVLAGRSRTDRHVYACAIIKAAHGGAVSAACHLHTIADLKGRLRMLTVDNASRRRLAFGAASVAALVAAGLALTASGTRATAAVSERIGDAVGIAPLAPQVAPAESTPPTPPAPSVQGARRVTVTRDGRTTTYEGEAADRYAATHPLPVPPTPPLPPAAPQSALVPTSLPNDSGHFRTIPDMPQILTTNCARDGKKLYGDSMVVNKVDDGKRMIVVCADRIQNAAAEGAAIAANSGEMQRNAYRSALSGLRNARIGIIGDASMKEADRRRALDAVDTSIREVEHDLAEAD